MSNTHQNVVVPTHCKAAITVNQGPNFTVELVEDYVVPTPGPGDLLLRIRKTGLCLSDIHFMKGDWMIPVTPGVTCAGHEGAGEVVALGSAVDPAVWKVGDRAGLKPIQDICHACDHCRSNNEVLCDAAVYAGAMCNGSYAQYVLSPARYTSRLPEGVPDELAGPILCSGSTIYTALKLTGAKAGEFVAIPGGGGGVGSMGVQYAAALGLRVVVIDTGAEKKKLSEDHGALFVDFKTSEDVVAEVQKLSNGGCHAVVVTGGTPSAYTTAPSFLRKAGTLVCVGLPAAGTAIAGADPLQICFNKLRILGSLVGGQKDVDEALAFAARGLIKPQLTILPFAKFKEGLAMLAASQVAGRLVVDFDL